MQILPDVLIYVVVLVVQVLLSNQKKYISGFILPFITAIYFLSSRAMNGYIFCAMN